MTSEGPNPSQREYTNNPLALRKAKIVFNFGLSECNRVEGKESSPMIRRANFPIKIEKKSKHEYDRVYIHVC